MLQNNKRSILLEWNGKALSGKRTRHINIVYFIITDWVNMKEISIDWCPTKKMVADFTTKPLPGSQFRELRDYIMRVRATTEWIELKLISLRAEKMAIKAKIDNAPTNCGLLKELQEVKEKNAKGDIELNDEVKMILTDNEKISHSNVWSTHQETTESLKKSRGKVYSMLLGQCTQVTLQRYLTKLPIFYIKNFITTYIQGQSIFCLSFPPCRQSNRTRAI